MARKLSVDERMSLVRKNTLEIVNEKKIVELLEKNKPPMVYCGYETSGEIHLGHLVSMTKLIDLEKAGFKVKVLFADWHTFLNKKGDWKFIGDQLEKWKKSFKDFGIKAEFVRGTKIEKNLPYIDDVFSLALKITLNRGLRSMQEIARNPEDAKISQMIYPLMQIADFKYLKVDGALGGIEQRKIHMLALESLKEIGYKTPFFIHHELIPSLKGPQHGKMSSSVKESMISISDSPSEISKKISKAYCPSKEIKENPILSIAKLIIFPKFGGIEVKATKGSGDKDQFFKNYEDLEKTYERGFVWPSDLKNAVAEHLEKIIAPIRKK